MTKQSSIHFEKCRTGETPERHNAREYTADAWEPRYFLPEKDRLPNTFVDLLETGDTSTAEAAAEHARAFFDNLKDQYSGRGKRPRYENCRREAVLNLAESSTEEDVKNVIKYLKERWHLTCTSYAIHRDEGKIIDGKVERNWHAHLILDSLYLDKKSGKPRQAWRAIKRKDLSTIQDDIAKIMHMERTHGDGKTPPRAHLDRKTYKTIKEAEDRILIQRTEAEAAAAKAEALTAQATEAAQAAALEAERAAKAKAEAAKQAQETARQAAQVRHDIEVHKLQPSGLLVNRALREANADQAAIIDTLQAKADATEAAHRQDLIKKDEQIRIMHEASEDRRQTIRQLRTQVAEQAATIRDQAETIETQQTTIQKYEKLANTMYDVLEVLINAVPKKIVDTALNMLHAVEKLGVRDLWDWSRNHKKREQAARAEREAAERQAEEARRNRGYGR